jgi:hypothetical protein
MMAVAAFLSPAIPAALTKALPGEGRMSTDISPVIPPSIGGSEERWAAWVAKGAAHDRLLRRRWLIALPIFAVVAAVEITFVLIGARL